MENKIYIITLLFVFSLNIYSQNPEWINYHSTEVHSVAIEGDYIWAGGSDLTRINKINGEIIVYNKDNSSLPSHYIRSIAIDDIGNKWIGTDGGGLAKFDGTNWTNYIIHQIQVCHLIQ